MTLSRQDSETLATGDMGNPVLREWVNNVFDYMHDNWLDSGCQGFTGHRLPGDDRAAAVEAALLRLATSFTERDD